MGEARRHYQATSENEVAFLFYGRSCPSGDFPSDKIIKGRRGNKERFLAAFLACVFFAFSCVPVFAGTQEDEVVRMYKEFFKKRAACGDYKDYEKLNRLYATREKIAKMESIQTQELPDVVKAGMFKMLKPLSFDLSELEVLSVETDGTTATIRYRRKGCSDFEGTATLLREWGEWKIEQDVLTVQE